MMMKTSSTPVSNTQIEYDPTFDRDIEKLLKKYPHLGDDMDTFIRYSLEQFLDGTSSSGIFQMSNTKTICPHYYIVKKFTSQDFPGKGKRSGFRIIFALHERNEKITFIEIFHKKNQSNHSVDRMIERE